MKKIKSFT